MTQEKAKTYADGLRELADWYEKHSEMPELKNIFVHISDYTAEQARADLGAAAKALGKCEKSFDEWSVSVSRRFGPVNFVVSVNRSAICKKIVTYDCPESLLKELGKDFVEKLAVS